MEVNRFNTNQPDAQGYRETPKDRSRGIGGRNYYCECVKPIVITNSNVWKQLYLMMQMCEMNFNEQK